MIGLVSVLGMVITALGGSGEQQPPTKQERMLIGPFKLGDCYLGDKRGAFDDIEKGDGPRVADIMKTLNECSVWVIDRKKFDSKAGKWIFDGWGPSDPLRRPKLLLEGPFLFKLRDKQGEEFRLHIEEIHIVTGDIKTRGEEPSRRRIRFSVKFSTSPYKYRFAGEGAMVKDISRTSRLLSWDVTGKIWRDQAEAGRKK